MLIRKANLGDLEEIVDFNLKLAQETENEKLNRNIVRNGVQAVLNDNQKGFYLVAENKADEKELVGQLMITFEWSDWRNKCFWWIQSVYVDERYRNQEVFSSLYREVIKTAKSRKDISRLRLYVEKHNVKAKQVYESLGLKKTQYEVYELPL